jgi:hypothetical protein
MQAKHVSKQQKRREKKNQSRRHRHYPDQRDRPASV